MRFLISLALCAGAFAQCSIESVHGTWAVRRIGTMMIVPPGGAAATPVPYADMGIARYDLAGGFTLNGFLNIGGQIVPVNATGTIQVDPSCTATASFSIAGTPVSTRLVILGNGKEMRMLQTSGGASGIGEFRRLSWDDAQCSQDMLHGVYLGYMEGSVIAPMAPQTDPVALPLSGLLASSDVWGNVSTVGKLSVLGYLGPDSTQKVTATINPDCTGADAGGGGANFLILLDNGNELWFMPTKNPAAPTISIGRMIRTSIQTDPPKW